MAQVITFELYRPPPRYDALAWTQATIYEAPTADGVGVLIDTLALSPVDADPSDPAYRNLTTELASSTPELWYWIVFKDASGDSAPATEPVQNVSSSYVSLDELFRVLKIRTPTDEQRAAAARVLQTAYGEIGSEIDLAATVELTGWQLSLAAEVQLERAVEHWRQQEAPFGLVTLSELGGAERTARDTWERHAHKLAPLKNQWGIA